MMTGNDSAITDNTFSNNRFIRNGLLIAVLAAFLFSTKPILIKFLYQLGMEPVPLMWLRMMLATPVYLVVAVFAWKRSQQTLAVRDIAAAAAIGLLGYYLASYLDLLALQHISAQFERVVLYAYPTFVVLLGALFFNQPLSGKILLPLVITYAGLLLMYSQELSSSQSSDNPLSGSLLVLASALAFAGYILLSKTVIQKTGSLLFTSIAMTSAAIATAVHHQIQQPLALPDDDSQMWGLLILLALFATVLPSFLTSEAIKRIGPARASMTGILGPVITSILAIVFLGEALSLTGLAGMAMVIWGVALLAR